MKFKRTNPRLFTLIVLICMGCSNQERKESGEPAIPGSESANKFNGSDSLISYYIENSKPGLVADAKEGDSVSWMFDRIEQQGNLTYKVYQLGHNMSDAGGSNPRFVTDIWLYIDTVNRDIYEYNVAEDTLSKWSK